MSSRDIKFRVWDAFQKQYVFTGFHVIGEVTVFGGIESVIRDTREARFTALGYETTIEAWNDFKIEQWTGLTLPNGTDIYEGDILNTKAARWEVVFERGAFVAKVIWSVAFEMGETLPLADVVEHAIPLGNRYENPDLLTV